MALQIITLDEMKAYSPLAEVQALTDDVAEPASLGTLPPMERQAIALLESELRRRITVDSSNVSVTLRGSGRTVLPLPERLNSFTSVVSATLGDITSTVETIAGGWLLRAVYGYTYHWRAPVTISGKWGLATPDAVKDALMDVIEALAVRKADPVTHRDELAPWGSISDGSMQASRGSLPERQATLENLLRYDVRARLRGYYRPDIVEMI